VVTEQESKINAEIKLDGKIKEFENIRVVVSIMDSKNNQVAQHKEIITVKNTIPSTILQELSVQKPHLWSVDNPYLYQLKTEVYTDDIKVDESLTPFGIRTFNFDVDSGFYLNGKKFEIRGVNLHHDLGALGAAFNKRAAERQLEIMKAMGVNAMRTAHNPPAPEFLDLCDKMGFLVMDEAFDVWKKKKVKYDYHTDWDENHEHDLRDMILRDRNHPCIILWSIGNEIREQFDSSGISIARELVGIVKSIDTTRPVTCALTETDPLKNFIYQSGALDLLGFNYKIFDWSKFPANYPGEIMIATENISAYATRGHYDMPSDSVRYWPVKYGDSIIGANAGYTASAYDMTCAYWGATHEETLKAFYKNKFIPGLFIWSGFDFIGEPEPYGWPAKSSYYGVVDLAGFPKDVYYLYQSIWTDTPVLHVFPHWNWHTGQLIDVWAYYNQADEVELFLNGKSLGTRKKENDDLHVMWRVNYLPGILKAISRKNGKVVLEKEIRTAGQPAKIELMTDRQEIDADGKDLSFITVKITDDAGNIVPNASNMVNFNIIGKGFIAGVDNGYQASHEPFKASERKAYNGMCLAIIQSKGKGGNIVLEATSKGLEPATISLIAR
jgi:beta-galactosidase